MDYFTTVSEYLIARRWMLECRFNERWTVKQLVGSGRYLIEVLNGNRPEGLRKAVKRPDLTLGGVLAEIPDRRILNRIARCPVLNWTARYLCSLSGGGVQNIPNTHTYLAFTFLSGRQNFMTCVRCLCWNHLETWSICQKLLQEAHSMTGQVLFRKCIHSDTL